jgi:hypothetical protein
VVIEVIVLLPPTSRDLLGSDQDREEGPVAGDLRVELASFSITSGGPIDERGPGRMSSTGPRGSETVSQPAGRVAGPPSDPRTPQYPESTGCGTTG